MTDEKIKSDLLEHAKICGEIHRGFPMQEAWLGMLRVLGKEWFGSDFEDELTKAFKEGKKKGDK